MPEPIVIVTVLSMAGGLIALGCAAFHTWRYESHRHAAGPEERK